MVGVAGKSKGCATCRKRKIKCDETRPFCKRCEHSGLQCDRYERFPIFIDRNLTGYRKRVPLEEVKPYPQPQRLFSPEAESVRLISWFRETHIHSHPPHHVLQAQGHWLDLVGARPLPHPALKAALLAMSFTKWSQIETNSALRQHGRRQYQRSLDLTQKALLHTEHALSDDILATTCVMALYELSDPSCQSSDNWLDHIDGTGNLLCLRGPTNFASAESRAILEHIRRIFMIRCLATKTPCVFGSPQWRQLPWHGTTKSVEQQVFDQGLRSTSLWKDCDSLSTGKIPSSDFDALLSTCIDIAATLDSLAARISCDISRTEADGVVNTATLLLSITALGVRLGAAVSAQRLLDTLDSAAIFDTPFETVSKARSLCETRRHMARRILGAVEARMKMQAGTPGSLSMLWPLRLAQEQFTPADPEAEQCKETLALLSLRTSPFDALGLPSDRYGSSAVYRSF